MQSAEINAGYCAESGSTDRISVIAIVGSGAYCTYALERLAAEFSANPLPNGLSLTIFDRADAFGSGLAQSARQPNTSCMNRVVSQVGFAADESCTSVRHLLPYELRLPLGEWLAERHRITGDRRYALGPRDIPTRALHGEALEDAFKRYVTVLSSVGAQVSLAAVEVTDCRMSPDGRLQLYDPAGVVLVEADAVLFATGHPDNQPRPGSQAERLTQHASSCPDASFLCQAYPLARKITEEAVPAGSRVGVLGMGLTALDVILHLTEGRGGRFEVTRDPKGLFLQYRPSGREPQSIVPVAPSGLFARCRADNFKASDPSGRTHKDHEHQGRYLRTDIVARLRETVGSPTFFGDRLVRQLDFGRHIFPLLVLEMAYTWYLTLLGPEAIAGFHAAVAEPFERFVGQDAADRDAAISCLLSPVDAWFDTVSATIAKLRESSDNVVMQAAARRAGDVLSARGRTLSNLYAARFDWRDVVYPLSAGSAETSDGWHDRLIAFLREDMIDAVQGNLDNPLKACCDGVWRDLRHVLSDAVDYGGLTARSQAEWRDVYWRLYCRMSNGPGIPAQAKLLALLDAKLIDVSVGPDFTIECVTKGYRLNGARTRTSRTVETLVDARVHDFDLSLDISPLYRNMAGHGLVRAWENPDSKGGRGFAPGSLDLDRDFHPIGRDGRANTRVTILGAPAEGLVYFHLSAVRPQSNSTIVNIADRWAVGTLDALREAFPMKRRAGHATVFK